MKKNFFKVFGGVALAAVALTSCGEKDLYDSNAIAEAKKSEFAQNFMNVFPGVNLNQSWDFSTPGTTYASTRAQGDIVPQVQSDWYYVEQQSIDYFENELVEGANNRAKGKPFIMSVPNNGFGIVPIHQGGASWTWDLHMVVEQGGVVLDDVKVWEKHRDLECQLNDETLKTDVENAHNKNFEEDFGYARNGEDWYSTKKAFTLEPGGWWQNYEYGWNTMQAKAIRGKFINFDNLPVGANIYFYLAVWDGQDKKEKGVEPRIESSLGQMMVALTEAPLPSNIDPKNEVTIIGCEDNSSETSDWDMNDLVFMVVGYPDVPKPIVIEDKQYDEVVCKKRYMVEDLGSTDDFDFNDVVVDVEQYKTHEIELVNGAKVSDEVVAQGQRAVVRAMGGTLDFTLKIGDTTWSKSGSGYNVATMYNTSNPSAAEDLGANAAFAVSGWNPIANNISVTVNGLTNDGIEISFPKPGQVPMIIATDPTIQWMKERVLVPASWWTEGPSNK